MSIWSIIISCWVVGSVPFGVFIGKLAATNGYPSPVAVSDEPTVDVDAFLERLFAA